MALMSLHRVLAAALVAGSNDVTRFHSDAGFTLTYPVVYRADHNELTSTKLYIYLADDTPVDAVTVSTDDSFTERATLDTVTQRYADAITTAYKDLKVLTKEHTTLAGQPAFRAVYRGVLPVQYSDDTVREELLKVHQTWTIKMSRAYTLTYKALARDYNRYLPHARRITKTFTLE